MARRFTGKHVYVLEALGTSQSLNLSDIDAMGYDILYIKYMFPGSRVYNDIGRDVLYHLMPFYSWGNLVQPGRYVSAPSYSPTMVVFL